MDRLKEKPSMKSKLLWIAPIAILVAAQLGWPYGFYIFLRIAVCAFAIILSWMEYSDRQEISSLSILLGLMAALYNPFLPIYLTREIWMPINILSIVILIWHYVDYHKRNS